MLTKELILETIKNMPEEKFEDIDVLFERIVILEKIEKGEKDIEEGKTYSTEKARQKLEKWLK